MLKSYKNIKIKKFINKKYYSTPLHTELPGLPKATENVRYQWSEPSKVENVDGIRVVAIETTTPQSSITLSFNSGSRVENSSNAGTASLFKHFAYRGTPNYTQVGITRAIETHSVSFHSSVTREDVSYNANLARYQVESFFPLLGEVSRPKIREFEVRELESSVLNQASTLASCPLNLLVDRFHRVAYRGQGLGLSISPTLGRVELEHDAWVEALTQFRDQYIVRNRAVVVGVGVPQKELVNLVQSSLSGLQSQTTSNDSPKSTYYGGEHLGDRTGSTHLLVGFEGLPVNSPHLHALNLVYTILGGGRKYSTEGPGSGKTSLLNRNLVEKLSNVHSASAYNANYHDSGLFGVYVNAEGHIASVVDSLYEQINSLSKIDANVLESAKRQLKIQLAVYYDSNERRAELAKRFVQNGLEPVSVQRFVSSVDNVTLDEFKRVVKTVFSSRPVLVAEGDIAGLPGTEQLIKKIN